MKTFKLPDWLGGHECALTDYQPEPPNVRVAVNDPTAPTAMPWFLELSRSLLTEVEPPLPPMPDAPAVLVISPNGPAAVWRIDTWYGERMLMDHLSERPFTWAELHARAQKEGWDIIPLVPDPAHGAPDLPWQLKEGDAPHVYASVGLVDSEGGAFVEAKSRMNPREMRTIAAALCRAAAEGEVCDR